MPVWWSYRLPYVSFMDCVEQWPIVNAEFPGFVHGDLKPENLLVDTGYVLKVSDFGLARANGLTAPLLGSSLGTSLYLAPECWEGEEATEKSDVYAAGMLAL